MALKPRPKAIQAKKDPGINLKIPLYIGWFVLGVLTGLAVMSTIGCSDPPTAPPPVVCEPPPDDDITVIVAEDSAGVLWWLP